MTAVTVLKAGVEDGKNAIDDEAGEMVGDAAWLAVQRDAIASIIRLPEKCWHSSERMRKQTRRQL